MSLAQYVIICDTRIQIAAADTPISMVCAASEGAASLLSHIATVYHGRLKEEDAKPVSELQHQMMEDMLTYTEENAEDVCQEMIKRLYELEGKFR